MRSGKFRTRRLPSSGWDPLPSNSLQPAFCCSKKRASCLWKIRSKHTCPTLQPRGKKLLCTTCSPTREDLLRWSQGLFGGKVLKPESLAKMITPFKNDYAMGIGVRTINGRKVLSHGGGIEGFNTDLFYYPENKLTVVVLANLN